MPLGVDQKERFNYFIDKLQELLDPKNEIGFDDYVTIGGLLELTRQYSTMPSGVKELSVDGLRESIVSLLDKHGTLLSYREQIPIKELREPLTIMFLVTKLQNEKYISKLFELLSDTNTFIGILRAVKYAVTKGIIDCEKHDLYKILDDLIYLLVEFIEFKGHTLSDIHRLCKNKRMQTTEEQLFAEIYNQLKLMGTMAISSFKPVECIVKISCEQRDLELVKVYVDKIFSTLIQEGRVKDNVSHSTSNEEDKVIMVYSLYIYKIDVSYLHRLLQVIVYRLEAFQVRTNYKISSGVFLITKQNEQIEITSERRQQKLQPLSAKHFDNLWRNYNNLNISPYLHGEMLRINDWITMLNNVSDKQLSFNALWSIMEFLLVDSVFENKIDSICRNFIPYMGLFYYRKVLKTFFKKLINMYGKERLDAKRTISSLVEEKVPGTTTVADAFCIFLFRKELRHQWWEGLDFENASKTYINIQTDRIHMSLNKPSVAQERFEGIVKNDLRQMYRLRNMLTHSGINDDKILENTYYRLKYYVETLLNAIAYVWGNSNNEYNIYDLNDFKRIDWQLYRERCKSIQKIHRDNETGILFLVNYQGIVPIPPNKFSFLSDIGKDQ